MHKTIKLLTLTGTLVVAQSITPSFTGHMVSCGDGYTVFRTFGGQLVRTSDMIGCREYTRYREWLVYTEPGGGAHPDRVMAIEPAPSNWDASVPPPTRKVRRWYQFWK